MGGACSELGNVQLVDHAAALSFGDLGSVLAPLLAPPDLGCAAAASHGWRQAVATTTAQLGGIRPWLSSDFAKDLERDSLRLFRLAEESTWFDTRHFVAALLAVTPPGESSLSRALQLLRFPPCFLPLPPPAACNSFVDAGEEGGWVCLTLPCQPYPDAAMAKELQRQWSSAFLTDDRTANAAARSLCVDVLCRWRALWSVARCARDPANAPRATRTDYVFRRSSLRGTEWWKVSILDLSIGSAAKARADFGGVNPSGSIAAVCLAYWEKRLMG